MKHVYWSLCLCVVSFSTVFASNLRLGSPFQEHMVLQRETPINIWGQTTVNASVVITFDGVSTSIQANSDGVWKATLPAHGAGGPYGFLVRSGTEVIEFNDVMVGEVWICSGQSNMFMGYQQIPDIKALDSLSKNSILK